MTVEEIFSKLSSHMIKGLMLHDQMSDYYDFLSLRGYKRCHEYHYKKEMCGYRKLHRYYINHYGRLIEEQKIEDPESIPSTWYRYSRKEVDASTKRSAVRTGIEKWIAWEKETKDLYEMAYRELMKAEEEAAAIFLQEFICNVDCELKYAERKAIDLETVDYNMAYIVGEQTKLHDKYKRKMKW